VIDALAPGPDGQQVAFFLSSDEPIPTQLSDGLDVIPSSGVVIEDLYGLAACDFFIGPPSTFGRWAAFYGDVPVHWMEPEKEAPSYDSFHTRVGLGSGRRGRAWVDPAME
jgi:hypothetical protein